MLNGLLWPRDVFVGDGTHQPNLMLNIVLAVVAFFLTMMMVTLVWPTTLVVAIGAFVVAAILRWIGPSGTIGGVLLAVCLGVLLGVWF